MTIAELSKLRKGEKILYEGEVWKFKSVGQIGIRPVVKIQRIRNKKETLFCADPEDIQLLQK